MEPSGSRLSSKLPADRSSIVHVCHYCCKSFARRSYLLRHIAAHRSPSLECAACRRQFGRADSLRRHRCRATITTAAAQLSPPTEPASRRRHGCPRCEKSYTRRATLLQHVARVHRDAAESVVDAHPCALCRRVFVSARSLDNHQLSIHAGESAAPPGRPCARRGRRLASQSSVDRRRCPTNGRGNVEETATSTSRTHDDSRGDNLQISDNGGDGVRHASHVDDDATASRQWQSAAPPPRPTPRTCRCCGRAFSSAGWLRRHLNTAHAHQPSHSPLTTDLSRTSDPSQISSHSQTSDSSQTNDPSQIGPLQLVVVLQAANVSHHQASSSHDASVLYQTTNVSESTSDPLQSSDPSQTNDRSRVAIVLQAVNGSSQASNAHAASVSYQTTSVSESSTSDPPLPAGGGSEARRRVWAVAVVGRQPQQAPADTLGGARGVLAVRAPVPRSLVAAPARAPRPRAARLLRGRVPGVRTAHAQSQLALRARRPLPLVPAAAAPRVPALRPSVSSARQPAQAPAHRTSHRRAVPAAQQPVSHCTRKSLPLSFPSTRLEIGRYKYVHIGSLGERCKLPQRGLGRSRCGSRFFVQFSLKICWQQILLIFRRIS